MTVYSVVVSEMAGLSADVDPLQLWGHLQLHRALQVYLDPRPHLIRQVNSSPTYIKRNSPTFYRNEFDILH